MKDLLEIIIPTFNRVVNLKNSIYQILDENSPVKECKITILDNCSEDDTQNYCLSLKKKYKNINYIRHNKNLGMGANICRAMEVASMPYYWIVGDDDNYDFCNWFEVKKAMDENADCIVVSDFTLVDNSVKSIISQLGLLSSGIYKTKNITSEVLQNANANIINMFPHMALICDLVNKNKIFKILSKPVAIWGVSNPDPEGKAYIRGAKKNSEIMPRLRYQFLVPAWFNCLQMIQDKELRLDLINNTHKFSKLSRKLSSFQFLKNCIKDNKILFYNYYQNNIDIFVPLNIKNKLIYILARVFLFFEEKVGVFKLKSFIKRMLNVKTIEEKEHYKVIKVLGFKIKRKR